MKYPAPSADLTVIKRLYHGEVAEELGLPGTEPAVVEEEPKPKKHKKKDKKKKKKKK